MPGTVAATSGGRESRNCGNSELWLRRLVGQCAHGQAFCALKKRTLRLRQGEDMTGVVRACGEEQCLLLQCLTLLKTAPEEIRGGAKIAPPLLFIYLYKLFLAESFGGNGFLAQVVFCLYMPNGLCL